MGASITLAGQDLIAQKQGAKQILNVSRFILANVPGLDPNGPVDRAAGKPGAAQVVGTYPVTQAGYVNPNQVVYSLMLGSDVGDFDFNWIGLESAENVLVAVAYVAPQQKRQNIPPLQIGNNLTRNFLVVFDGALELTGITIDASTWQHDFTARLTGIDERERLSNRDVFGRACFFGSALQVEKVGATFYVKTGTAYVEGIRLENPGALLIGRTSAPMTAWLDVSLKRELSDVVASWKVVYAAENADYTDSVGMRHYCVPLADMVDASTLTDRRPVEPIDGPLVRHFAARVGDYEQLRARATTKEDVDLGNLPNAKSDDPGTNSSDILATTKALNALKGEIVAPLVGQVAAFATLTPPAGWLSANGALLSRTTFSALFAVIGNRFGAGDGSTTFKLPDLRGEFIRGWDNGRGVDPGRAIFSAQDFLTASHTHTASTDAAGEHTHTASSDTAGDHTHSFTKSSASNSTAGSYVTTANNGSSRHTTLPAGEHTHAITIDGVAAHTHTVTVDATGGSETRPRNVALIFCIKY